METIRVYTDGGCYPNPGKGGWSIVVSKTEYYRGQKKMTTNNEMELTAVKNAILYARKYHKGKLITIFSDSKYCVNGFNDWMYKWQKRGWQKRGGIKNLQLWKDLFLLKDGVGLKWVKAHNGNELNELADSLAVFKEKKWNLKKQDMKLDNIEAGDPIVYIPKHENKIKEKNIGVVTSKNEMYVFVRYLGHETSQATRHEDLYCLKNRPDLMEKLGFEIKPINKIYKIYLNDKKQKNGTFKTRTP